MEEKLTRIHGAGTRQRWSWRKFRSPSRSTESPKSSLLGFPWMIRLRLKSFRKCLTPLKARRRRIGIHLKHVWAMVRILNPTNWTRLLERSALLQHINGVDAANPAWANVTQANGGLTSRCKAVYSPPAMRVRLGHSYSAMLRPPTDGTRYKQSGGCTHRHNNKRQAPIEEHVKTKSRSGEH